MTGRNRILPLTGAVMVLLFGGRFAAGGWEQLGLADLVVYDLYADGTRMYAATGDGIYVMDALHPDSGWETVGLQGVHIGDVLAFGEDVIYGGTYAGPYALYRTTNGGGDWIPLPWGAGAGGFVPIFCFSTLSGSYMELIGGGPAVIATSYDGGMIWQPVWGAFDWMGMGIHFVRPTDQDPQIIWAGGESAIFAAILLKSTDGGFTWTYQNPPTGGDNRCHDVASRPDNPDVAYVGMEGIIQRTVDGGDHWVQLAITEQYHYTVEIDTIRHLIIYVSGSYHTDPMTIWKSVDGGESWTIIAEPTYPNNRFLDFILVCEPDSNVLYCASEHGVFKYTDFDLEEDSSFVCGDADASNGVDIDDAVYLIGYIFLGGPEPLWYDSGDVDCSGLIDIDDAVYLIEYIFSGGNTPCDPNGDEVPDC